MQGQHAFNPHARMILDLEAFVVPDHFLRRVNRVMDFTFIRALTAPCYATDGRPSIDPEVFFRIVLVGFLYGIASERRLCEEVRDNLAYRWFCRLSLDDPVPDHSSFTRIRDRFGEAVFAAAFQHLVKLCFEKGLVSKECRVATDATLIEADASLDSLVHNDPEEAQKEAEALRGRARSAERPPSRKISNATHTSQTDPEATLAEKRGSPRHLKYKVHQSMDADSRIILDTHVTTGARHDKQCYLEQLERVRDQYQLHIVEALADSGYGAAAIIRELEQRGTRTFIPLWSSRVGNSKYLTGDLVYDKAMDRFRCPAGKYLTPNPAINENHKRYASRSADCRECQQAPSCPARCRKGSHQRFILHNVDQDLFEEVHAKMRDPTFRDKLAERMWKAEGLFAEAKQRHNLSRAKYRGRAKVQIQAYLTAFVQNLKRFVAALLLMLYSRPYRVTSASAT